VPILSGSVTDNSSPQIPSYSQYYQQLEVGERSLPATNHKKLSQATLHPTRNDNAQTHINIALWLYWWYFHDALENGGNRYPASNPSSCRPAKRCPASHSDISSLAPAAAFYRKCQIKSWLEQLKAGWKVTSSNASAHSIQPFIPGEVLIAPCGKPVVPTLPPAQNRCLNRKERERGWWCHPSVAS